MIKIPSPIGPRGSRRSEPQLTPAVLHSVYTRLPRPNTLVQRPGCALPLLPQAKTAFHRYLLSPSIVIAGQPRLATLPLRSILETAS